MSQVSLSPYKPQVNSRKFVPATVSAEVEEITAEYWREFDAGRAAYRNGQGLRHCVTDAMTQGWLTSEAAGADAYWLGMMQGVN